jgi:chromatin remodeling complex protein RSC6
MSSAKPTKPTANKKATTPKKAGKNTKDAVAPQPAAPVKVEEPVAAPAKVEEPVAAATDAAHKKPASFEEQMENCIKVAQGQAAACRTLVSSLKDVKKAHDRETKDLQKASSKKNKNANKDGAKKPLTGFAKPCKISDELADFLHDIAGNADVKRGIEMSRTDVTKMLNKYFVEKGLRNADDKRHILFENDVHLAKLLPVPKGEKLTYFNLQKVLKGQFKSATPAAAADPAVAPAATTSA